MHEKYKHNKHEIILDAIDGADLNTIAAYRAYYKAKLKKMICPKCKSGMSASGCEKNGVTWTRREIPEWLGDL